MKTEFREENDNYVCVMSQSVTEGCLAPCDIGSPQTFLP